MGVQSTMHLEQLDSMPEYKHLAKTVADCMIAITSSCPNPIRPNQIFCGSTNGYVYVVDVQ